MNWIYLAAGIYIGIWLGMLIRARKERRDA